MLSGRSTWNVPGTDLAVLLTDLEDVAGGPGNHEDVLKPVAPRYQKSLHSRLLDVIGPAWALERDDAAAGADEWTKIFKCGRNICHSTGIENIEVLEPFPPCDQRLHP